MSKLESLPYGAGYLATMALGLAVSEEELYTGSSTEDKIKHGLDSLFQELVSQKQNQDLSAAIANKTKYSSLDDFENKFKSGDSNLLGYVNTILTQKNKTIIQNQAPFLPVVLAKHSR